MDRRSRHRLALAALFSVAALTYDVARARLAHADDDVGAGDEAGTAGTEDEAQVGVAGDAYADTDPSALTDFEPTLDPHGTWSDDLTYGTIWTPSAEEVGSDFAPYVSAGHWGYDDGDVWMSDYTWGWATFHYGRWVWLRERRWAWIPGRLYADAWVVWRVGDDAGYVGWAPMPPTWGWRGGVAGLLGFVSWEPYVFCPSSEVFAPSIAPRVVSGEPAAAMLTRTRPYVRASPVVGAPAGPSRPQGPSPASLGVDVSRVPRPTGTDLALMRARQFARPSTAQALGARAPVSHVVRPRLVARPYRVERPANRPQTQRRK